MQNISTSIISVFFELIFNNNFVDDSMTEFVLEKTHTNDEDTDFCQVLVQDQDQDCEGRTKDKPKKWTWRKSPMIRNKKHDGTLGKHWKTLILDTHYFFFDLDNPSRIKRRLATLGNTTASVKKANKHKSHKSHRQKKTKKFVSILFPAALFFLIFNVFFSVGQCLLLSLKR